MVMSNVIFILCLICMLTGAIYWIFSIGQYFISFLERKKSGVIPWKDTWNDKF
jgi:hypothetical protein